jgi:hypothetical protein
MMLGIYGASVRPGTQHSIAVMIPTIRGRSSMVERQPSKLNVEGSSPFARFLGPVFLREFYETYQVLWLIQPAIPSRFFFVSSRPRID